MKPGPAVITNDIAASRFERSLEGASGELIGPDAVAAALDRSRALAEVAQRHHSELVRFLTARTGSAEDAKEILQEAYAKLLVLDRSGSIRDMVAYLRRIAVNLAIDRGRRRASYQRYCSALPIRDDQEFSAEVIAEARERLTILEHAIGDLPPRCREAFILHVQSGMTFVEVGREMRITDRMVKKHFARALRYLQACLDAAE